MRAKTISRPAARLCLAATQAALSAFLTRERPQETSTAPRHENADAAPIDRGVLAALIGRDDASPIERLAAGCALEELRTETYRLRTYLSDTGVIGYEDRRSA